MPKKRNNRKGKRGKAGTGDARLSQKQTTDARKRKVFQVHRAIEEGALNALAENPNRSFQECMKLGIANARDLITTNKIGLKNITMQHLNIAIQALQKKGQNSPRNIMVRVLGFKRAELKTEDEIWRERFQKARIGNPNSQIVIRQIHYDLMNINRRVNPGPEVIDGLVHKYASETDIRRIKQAVRITEFFVIRNAKGKLVWTTFYAKKITGTPRSLVRGTSGKIKR